MRASLLVGAAASAMALSALGCRMSRTSESGFGDGGDGGGVIPAGVVPADGGGYCCPIPIGYIPCAPFPLGGWSATPEGCANRAGGVDQILVGSFDERGCPVLGFGPCYCGMPTPQPVPDAGPGSSCYSDSINDLMFCGNPVCGGNHPHAYVCTSGPPTASDCVTFPDRSKNAFCCTTVECVRYAEKDSTCSTLGVAYSCPVNDGGATASGPGTCTPMEAASGERQTFCCT